MSAPGLPWIPPGDVLLLRVLAGERAAAAEAWAAWQSAHALDDVSWRTMRLLAAVIGRLDRLGIAAIDQPRLQGIRRYCWSNGQTKLARALPSLRALQAAGIELLVLKGGAAFAAGDATPADRYVGDVDLLVRPADADRALDLLAGQGWGPQSGGSIARVKGRHMPRHHAVNLARGKDGELDLHWSFLLQNRCAGDDEALWAAAEPASLSGLALRCPAPPWRLLQALTQGAQWASGNAADWAIDALVLLRRADLDWTRFAREVAARRLEGLVGVTAGFLRRELGVALPPALQGLAQAVPGEPWSAEAAALQQPDSARDAAANAALTAAARRRADGRPTLYAERLRERRLPWAGLRCRLAGRLPLGIRPQADGSVRLELPDGGPPGPWRRLFVRVAAEGVPGRRRLDVSAGLEWIVRWRQAGRVAWHGARLPEGWRGLAIELAPYRDLRRLEDSGELKPRQDPPVRVLQAWLAR